MQLTQVHGELPTLVIFCKRPMLNQGKARLAATIGADSALLIAKQLLNCALEDANEWPGHIVLTVSNKEDAEWAETLLTRHFDVLAQNSGNLGQRINDIDLTLRSAGHHSLVFIGTDAPMLDGDHYHQTIRALREHDYVFSRAQDGGVGIMANALPWPNISTLSWSTSTLGKELADCCLQYSDKYTDKTNSKITYVKSSYDIDEEVDLTQLYADLRQDKRPARVALRNIIEDLDCIKEDKRYA